MPHMLATLKGYAMEEIASVLKQDAPEHAREGLFLEHLWRNEDDTDEALFLFRVEDLGQARRFIERVHSEARREDPNVRLPHMTFLADS